MRYNILVLLFLIYSESFCQNFSPNEQLSQASYFQWTGENALISNNITSSLQAKSGFIWITTYNGIMRFDGTRVDVFDRSTLPFLSTDAFYKVYEDSVGCLWFTSQGSGLIKYENFEFKMITPENDSLPKSIRCISIETNGDLWIGSNSQGLYKLEKNRLRKIHHSNLDHIGIMDLRKDDQGNMWIATDGNGLVRYNGKDFVTYTEKEGLFSNSLNTLEIAPDGTLYIGTTKGLNFYKNNEIIQSDFLKNILVNYIITDKQDRIWLGAENGLGRIKATLCAY
jgi:ligand-binding sensor domain-containing protein